MIKAIGRTVLLVRDYDEALSFYRDILGFQVLFDETTDSGQRLLHAGLPGQPGVGLWFLQPGAEDTDRIGRQTGQHPCLVLYTEDCRRTAANLGARGVRFKKQPQEGAGAVFAHFEDLYGNDLVLVELKDASQSEASQNAV
jgi:catechol 2,3-dioxygenase-like lactoylglutathione lyase family enzyme